MHGPKEKKNPFQQSSSQAESSVLVAEVDAGAAAEADEVPEDDYVDNPAAKEPPILTHESDDSEICEILQSEDNEVSDMW